MKIILRRLLWGTADWRVYFNAMSVALIAHMYPEPFLLLMIVSIWYRGRELITYEITVGLRGVMYGFFEENAGGSVLFELSEPGRRSEGGSGGSAFATSDTDRAGRRNSTKENVEKGCILQLGERAI